MIGYFLNFFTLVFQTCFFNYLFLPAIGFIACVGLLYILRKLMRL